MAPAAAAGETAEAAQEAGASVEEIEQRLAQARTAIRDKRYIDPENDNALLHYRNVLAIDPENGEARQGIDRLAEVLIGRGFLLLRGLPVERWSMRESATAFFGLGAHLGSARSQNGKGHVLGHVQDLGLDVKDPNVRIYQTHERQTYHTDSCDIVGLLCLKTAKSGGLSALVSSTTIFNEMRRRRPDLLKLLFQPLATDRRGEVPEGQKPYFEIPVFNWHKGYLTAIYQRQYIDSAQRFPDAPRLTPQQVEALDMFDQLANDPALNMFMEFKPGDVQLVHNHTMLHDRTDFEDWPEPERRRHLLRLWLAASGARPLPEVFAQRYGSIAIGDRGGIIVHGTKLHAPLEAV
ncbi:MAG: TauD/TfdA family dioxygenase [Reyranella sp.]|nr:TauD/TfdA family dioxygenase [Reyranella sp.]